MEYWACDVLQERLRAAGLAVMSGRVPSTHLAIVGKSEQFRGKKITAELFRKATDNMVDYGIYWTL
jgi:hypothetical protein